MEFSNRIRMSSITISSLWISSVCMSDAIVHLVQEMVKISRGKITGLFLFLLFLFLYYLDSDYIANQTKLGFSWS